MLNVVKEVNDLLDYCLSNLITDIHIEPIKAGLRVRVRRDGLLEKFREYQSETSQYCSRIKVLAHLDTTTAVIQDGRFTYRGIDVRVSVMPTYWGEKIVIRLLFFDIKRSFQDLGLPFDLIRRLEILLRKDSGLILVTGPTGSGKTTTLYSVLQSLDYERKNIITIEDPIEYQLDKINQVQINQRQGLTFAKVLRSVLRQDPDVIFLGEIRDQETAAIAFRAAMTGHLVLSTLHTRNTEETLLRLGDLGVDRPLWSAISAIVSQRLFRLTCTICQGKGCDNCQDGYRGRQGLFEYRDLRQNFLFSFKEAKEAVLTKDISDSAELERVCG